MECLRNQTLLQSHCTKGLHLSPSPAGHTYLFKKLLLVVLCLGKRLPRSLATPRTYTIPGTASLLTYIPSCLTGFSAALHKLIMTFQLFEVTVGDGKLRLCNVDSAPGVIDLPALPRPTDRGIVYMGGF